MTVKGPNPNCPGCAGAGEPPYWYDVQQGRAKEDDRVCCRLCYNLTFRVVHDILREMLERYAGKSSLGIIPEIQEDIVRGEEGKKFRRLLKWLWENPEDSGQDITGHPRGIKTTRSKTFKELFDFEPEEKAPKAFAPVPDKEFPVIPLCVLPVRQFKKTWTAVCKGMKNYKIPVFHHVKVDIFPNQVRMVHTDLDIWKIETCESFSFKNQFEILLPGRLVQKLLQSCDPKGDIGIGGEMGGIVYLRHQTTTWKIYTLDPENYPLEPEKEIEEENEEIAAA